MDYLPLNYALYRLWSHILPQWLVERFLHGLIHQTQRPRRITSGHG